MVEFPRSNQAIWPNRPVNSALLPVDECVEPSLVTQVNRPDRTDVHAAVECETEAVMLERPEVVVYEAEETAETVNLASSRPRSPEAASTERDMITTAGSLLVDLSAATGVRTPTSQALDSCKNVELAALGSRCEAQGESDVAPISAVEDSPRRRAEQLETANVNSHGAPIINDLHVDHVTRQKNALFQSGYLEGKRVQYLIDTGAEVSVISNNMLANLPCIVRLAFKDQMHTLQMASGQSVLSRGPVLCNVTIGDRTITEAFYAMEMPEDAILGMPAMTSLGLRVTMAGVDLMPEASMVQRLKVSHVYRLTAASDYTLPARSEVMIDGRVAEKPVGSVFIVEPRRLELPGDVLVARTVSGRCDGKFPVRAYNPTDSEIRVQHGQYIANVETVSEVADDADCNEHASDMSNDELPVHLRTLYDETCAKQQLS